MPPQRQRLLPAVLAAAAVLAGCAGGPPQSSAPSGGPWPSRDGPEARVPEGLDRVPDAEPRVEPLRSGGPNKPYEVLGQRYVPLAGDSPLRETGLASWYGRKFHGRPTASGERYDMYAMTAAHKTMPLPSYARVRNPANGREIIVRVNDRGPFHPGRVIDLSYTAALRLGVLGGVAPVEVERLTHDEIRAGVWRRDRTLVEPPPVVAEPALPPGPARAAGGDDDPLMALLADRTGAPVGPAPPVATPAGEPVAGGFWLQLGAFRQRDGAVQLQQRVRREADGVAPRVAVQGEGSVFRVHAGPYASRGEALQAADALQRLLALTPLLLERR